MALTNILYFLPEDNESMNQFNSFIIHKQADEITMRDIKQSFPLPGEYHFRFQYNYHEAPVWLDVNNEGCKLP